MGAMESTLCSELNEDCFNDKSIVKSSIVNARQAGKGRHPRQALPHPRVTDAVLNKANREETQKQKQQHQVRKAMGGDPLGSTAPAFGKEGFAAVYPPKRERSTTPWQHGVAIQSISVEKSGGQREAPVVPRPSSITSVPSTFAPEIPTVTIEADLVCIPSHQPADPVAKDSRSTSPAHSEVQPPPAGGQDQGWSVTEAPPATPRDQNPGEVLLGGGATLHGWINNGQSPAENVAPVEQQPGIAPYPRTRKLNEKRYSKTSAVGLQAQHCARPTFDDVVAKRALADRTTNPPVTVAPPPPSRDAQRLTTPYSALNTPPRKAGRPGGKFVTQVQGSPLPPSRGVARDHPTVLEVKRHSPSLLMTR